MLQELDDAIVEFGLEEVRLVEDLRIEKDVDTSQVHTRGGKTKTVATATQYSAEFVIGERIDVNDMFEENGCPKPLNITITDIKTPYVIELQNSLVTGHQGSLDESRISVIAESAETEKLW